MSLHVDRAHARLLAVITVALAVGGCSAAAPPVPTGVGPSAMSTPSAWPAALPSELIASLAPATSQPAPSPSPTSEPSATPTEYRLTYDWGTLPTAVTVAHEVQVPLAPPPGLPLPSLVGIHVGDHPEGDPKFQRISFTFRGAFPEYNLEYVRALTFDPSDTPVDLEGNAVLRIGFVGAQAHDNAGRSTVSEAPANQIGLQNLKSYGFGGDFEGYLTYGLGLQVAVDSDQILAVRAGELKKPDGAGDFYYVIHVDVMNG